MDRISISTSNEMPTTQAREMAITCLKGHAAKVGGAVGAEKPLTVFASFEGRLIGGMIGKVFWNWLYDPTKNSPSRNSSNSRISLPVTATLAFSNISNDAYPPAAPGS